MGPFEWREALTLVLAAEGPASQTPLAGLTIDRVELAWE